jgi:hypothetical protein
MARTSRIAMAAALGAVLLVCALGSAAAGPPAKFYWLGPYFAGLRVTYSEGTATEKTVVYGDCELPEGEGGCSTPVQIQSTSSCDRNPIALDRLPFKVFLLRGGGLAAQYESTAVDIGTGDRTVTVYADYELVGAALREIRPEGGPEEPQALAPPVYPMPVLRELKRVTVVAEHLDGARAIAEETELTPDEVRLRLRIADLLGPDALAHVPPPKMSIATVERLRQLSFNAQYEFARTARKHGLTKAELRKKVARVRGLAGNC